MPTIRNSSITSSAAGSYTVPWPSGSVAGDTAFLFVGGGWQVSPDPTGWTVVDSSIGSSWNGQTYVKQLTAGDITTGSVTIGMAGNYDTVIAMVVYVGAVNYRGVVSSRNGSGSTSIALTSSSTVQAADHVLLFGSNRANSVDTIDKGTGVATINAGNASGVVTEYIPGSSGSFTANFAYPTAGAGNYQIIIPIVDAGSTTLQVAGSTREALTTNTANLKVADVARETLSTTSSQLKVGMVAREVLRSGTTGSTQLQTGAIVRETLISSKANGRRRQLNNPC